MLPWLSAKADCREGRFLQIGNSFFLSKGTQNLSTGARCLFLTMALESGGKRSFVFPRATALKYGFSESSFLRYVKELVAARFIEVVSCGRFARLPNEYRFSFGWKGIEKATRPPIKDV